MKRILLILMVIILVLCLSGCGRKTPNKSKPDSKKITVFAAASLKDVLCEIQPEFEQSKGIKLSFNFSSSGTLQKQIEEGAPADLFFSAGKKQMDMLENENLIDKDSRRNILRNKLVLIISKEYKDKVKSISDLIGMNVKISIGEPETVPAGQYAKEYLNNINVWDKLSGRMVFAKDVRQVLTYIENGDAAAGIVYKSDAAVIKNSIAVQEFEESAYSPILYPAAIVSTSKDKASAGEFLDYLSTEKSKQVFLKYGFDIVEK